MPRTGSAQPRPRRLRQTYQNAPAAPRAIRPRYATGTSDAPRCASVLSGLLGVPTTVPCAPGAVAWAGALPLPTAAPDAVGPWAGVWAIAGITASAKATRQATGG